MGAVKPQRGRKQKKEMEVSVVCVCVGVEGVDTDKVYVGLNQPTRQVGCVTCH